MITADLDVPGLVRNDVPVVNTYTSGDWKFELLEDGSLFVTHWRGPNMVGHELFAKEVAQSIAQLFGTKKK